MEYIGKTEVSFTERYGVNWNKSISNKYFKDDVVLFGRENFDVTILSTSTDKNELQELEKFYIKSRNSIYPNGYNLQYGGDGGKHCDDVKKRISKTLLEKGSHNKGVRLKGINLNCKECGKEFYTNFSRGLPNNKTCSNECRSKSYGRKIKGTSILDNTVILFNNRHEAVAAGFLESQISAVVNGKRKHHKKYTWEYL